MTLQSTMKISSFVTFEQIQQLLLCIFYKFNNEAINLLTSFFSIPMVAEAQWVLQLFLAVCQAEIIFKSFSW